MMKSVAQLMIIAVVSAQRCRLGCNDPFIKDDELCKCVCGTSCESYQYQEGETCECIDRPCEFTCAPRPGGTATQDDFMLSAQPECACYPADGKDPCDPIYGGLW